MCLTHVLLPQDLLQSSHRLPNQVLGEESRGRCGFRLWFFGSCGGTLVPRSFTFTSTSLGPWTPIAAQ